MVTVDGGKGPVGGARSRWAIFVILQQKKKRFLRQFNRTLHVLKPYGITKLQKFISYFEEELNFSLL